MFYKKQGKKETDSNFILFSWLRKMVGWFMKRLKILDFLPEGEFKNI